MPFVIHFGIQTVLHYRVRCDLQSLNSGIISILHRTANSLLLTCNLRGLVEIFLASPLDIFVV